MSIIFDIKGNVLFQDNDLTLKELVEKNKRNLRNADLYNGDLKDVDLSYANLKEADLRGANLESADLRRANLCGADISFARLRGANLKEADLVMIIFIKTDFTDANLSNTLLDGIDLRDTPSKNEESNMNIQTKELYVKKYREDCNMNELKTMIKATKAKLGVLEGMLKEKENEILHVGDVISSQYYGTFMVCRINQWGLLSYTGVLVDIQTGKTEGNFFYVGGEGAVTMKDILKACDFSKETPKKVKFSFTVAE